MSMKDFGAAIADCRTADRLQTLTPSPKTLLRLAKCQMSLSLIDGAIVTLRRLHSIDPDNHSVNILMQKTSEIFSLMKSSLAARTRKDWATASKLIDSCVILMNGIDGTVVPAKWKRWMAEFELGRGDVDLAAKIARSVHAVIAGSLRD